MITEIKKEWELEQHFKEIGDYDISLKCARMYIFKLEVKM